LSAEGLHDGDAVEAGLKLQGAHLSPLGGLLGGGLVVDDEEPLLDAVVEKGVGHDAYGGGHAAELHGDGGFAGHDGKAGLREVTTDGEAGR